MIQLKTEKVIAKKNNSNDKKPNPFNAYWIYGLILVFFTIIFFLNPISETKEISTLQFEQEMLSKGDVEKIIIVNKETAEIYIKSDRLSDEQYKDIKGETGPQFIIKIGSIESFVNKLEKAQEDIALN